MSRRDLPSEWCPTTDANLPWEASVDGERGRLRLNDVRDGSRPYSLVVDGTVVEDFDRWPACWEKIDAWEEEIHAHEMERAERTRGVRPSPLVPPPAGPGAANG